MSLELLKRMARYLAAGGWVEDGKEAVIHDRLRGAVRDLPALFADWGLDLERQEQMLVACAGFTPRSRLPRGELPPPAWPVEPRDLADFFTSRRALLLVTAPGHAAVGTCEPLMGSVLGQLALLMGRPVDLIYLTPDEEARAREDMGRAAGGAPAVDDGPASRAGGPGWREGAPRYDEQSGPIVQLVDLILEEGLRRIASDIHIEPGEEDVAVRYRIDGVLVKVRDYNLELHRAVTSRCKLMAGMDISNRRSPQDGRIRYGGGRTGGEVDMRVSSFPSAHGEAVSIRLLQRTNRRVDLARSGMAPDLFSQVRRLLRATQGILLVTGPTGCGKTTTLYGMLRELDTTAMRVVTVEDPIEYQVPGVVQMQVNPRAGLTFSAGLRAFLRGDPDVLMVGEIRDHETADIAIKAALTGHLVLATLHTNSAAGAITRLLDMGIEPYNLSATVQGVLAQRLCRLVCPSCATHEPLTPEAAALFDGQGMPPPESLARAKGCPKCQGVGYGHRTAVHELLVVDESLRSAINRSAPEQELANLATGRGMRTLAQDALLEAAAGKTTLEEILRALGPAVQRSDEDGGPTE